MVDVLGLLLAIVVTAASLDDGTGAPLVLGRLTAEHRGRLKKVWADKKYGNNALDAWMRRTKAQHAIEVVERPPGSVGFVKLPKRWVVERTFAWLGRYRRNSRDYEYFVESSESMIRVFDSENAQSIESGCIEEGESIQIPRITGNQYRIASDNMISIVVNLCWPSINIYFVTPSGTDIAGIVTTEPMK